MTQDIRYPDEIQQAERQATLNKLIRLQIKARRKQAISLHGPDPDSRSCGNTDPIPAYMRPTNGRFC